MSGTYPANAETTAAIVAAAATTSARFTTPRNAQVAEFPLAMTQIATLVQAAGAAADSAAGSASNAASLVGTSATSFTPTLGSQAVTTQAGKAWAVGSIINLASTANPTTNFAHGTITAYSGTALTFTVDKVGASPLAATDWNITLSGSIGVAGTTGAAGPDGKAGFKYSLNTATTGDPGSGKFRFDNATFTSATKVAFSEADGNSNGLATFLATLDDGGGTNTARIDLLKNDGTALFSFYITGAIVDQGAYDEFPITPILKVGSPSNADVFYALCVPIIKGDTGATGAGGSTGSAGTNGSNGGNKFTLNTATSGDPGSGKFLLNNATLASATQVNISETDGDGGTIASYLATLDDSTSTVKSFALFKTVDGTKGIIGKITATLTDAGAYDTFPWTPVSSWGSPANNDVMYLTAFVVGDKGTTGSSGAGSGNVTGPVSSTSHHLALYADTSGTVLEDSTAAIGVAAANDVPRRSDADARYAMLAGATMSGALNFAPTATVASATTADIGGAASNYVQITGTVTITGLGTIAAGASRFVEFAGILNLTHNATSLILPGGANITTAAGDCALFVSEGSGNWRCHKYQKASGRTLLASSTTQSGDVELATNVETTTGTDATRAVSPDALAHSDYGKRVVSIAVTDPNGSAITIGEGKAKMRVNSVINGYNLIAVAANLDTASSSGLPSIGVRRKRSGSDVEMLTTNITIDANERDSSTAATAAVINTSNDDVQTADEIFIDIDTAGTGAKGLIVDLTFQAP